MKQLTQKLKSGQMQVLDVPVPSLKIGHLLIKNYYSIVSAGTESGTVRAARKGYIGKAIERPDQIREVVDTLKTKGPVQTYRAVMKKLDAYSPLGYSCIGEVIDAAPDINGFSIGDIAACGGLTANHSEIVSAPKNLCVNISRIIQSTWHGRQKDNNDIDIKYLKAGAYNTLGAIAMQGVRQADLRIGETCAVIGLGLLGQLTANILSASGVRVAGIDVDPVMVDMAGRNCLDVSLKRDDAGIDDKILRFSDGIGCDAVIITAATDSIDPINFAGLISRKKGTVVVVGDVPTGFDREPYYYRKELQVKMSCSYGPGRYDPAYEEKGIDYPPPYVRWTENRNMKAFQELVFSDKINLDYLTTHVFKLEDAPDAYDMMLEKSEPFIGILIQYERIRTRKEPHIITCSQPSVRDAQSVAIGFIGAGSYAQSHLLPNLQKRHDVILKGVMTASGTGSRSVADRFGFEFCSGNEDKILENTDINTVFIATRHDSHAGYVLKALQAGKHVFVEKPLCLTEDDLEKIKTCCRQSVDANRLLMVGYNRRFSPLALKLKETFGNAPMAMTYRVNAGKINSNSWIQDIEIGGGRIVGEVCHFIDFLDFINGSFPVSVYACAMNDPKNTHDVLTISMKYQNGSIGNISYFANGDAGLSKERIEIFSAGTAAVLDDFKTLLIYSGGHRKEKKLLSQDKGQNEEIRYFIDAISNGKASPISLEEIFRVSDACFRVQESLRTGQPVKL